ncbi:MAG: hypothetical protein L0226_02900 [Acidobacteria bacterium]|nr:hypothetical protein [Acidobacteriota bacterium]
MNAVLQINDYLLEGLSVPENEFGQAECPITSELSIEQKLACAAEYILELKNHRETLRLRLLGVERELALKAILLCNVKVREQELYAQVASRMI